MNIKENYCQWNSRAHRRRVLCVGQQHSVMWCLETLPRLEAASRRNFHCLGLVLGLDLAALVLLLPRGTNHREANFSPTTYYVN